MNDVATAAGVTKPVLYQHFDSKHHLYLALLSETGSKLIARLEDAAAKATSPREQVEMACKAYFHFFADEPSHFTVLYGEGVRSDPTFLDQLGLVEDASTTLTAELIAIDALNHDDRVLLARAMSGMFESAVRRWIQEGEKRSPDEAAELVAQLAWRGLRGVGTAH